MGGMEQVRQGMRVVDASGADVGTVEDLKMGDREATTAEGQTAGGDNGLIANTAESVLGGRGQLPPERAARLLRVGYVKIDAKGLFSGDVYAAADRIDRVEGDTIHLNVDKDQLAD